MKIIYKTQKWDDREKAWTRNEKLPPPPKKKSQNKIISKKQKWENRENILIMYSGKKICGKKAKISQIIIICKKQKSKMMF